VNRDATSAKQTMITALPAAPMSQAHGLADPSVLAITDGKPKMLLPRIALMTRAVTVHRPITRTSVGAVGSGIGAANIRPFSLC
jgi:hypothetical protein